MTGPGRASTAAHVRAAMEESIVRGVHGTTGSLEEAATRVARDVFESEEGAKRWAGMETMSANEVREYVRAVTFPKASDGDRFVARPGFQMALRLPYFAKPEPPREEEEAPSKRAKTAMTTTFGASRTRIATTAISASGPPVTRRSLREVEPDALAVGTSATSVVARSRKGKIERALEKMLMHTDEAEDAQKLVIEIEEEIALVQAELQTELNKVPKADLSDMPDFELPVEATIYTGDPEDRHEVLAHKKNVDNEIERLKIAKEDWIKNKKLSAKREAKHHASAQCQVKMKKLLNKLDAANKAAAAALERAAAASDALDRARIEMGMTEDRSHAYVNGRESKRLERDRLKQTEQFERQSKRLERERQKEAERVERERMIKAAEEEERLRLEELNRFPMEDLRLIEYDARMAAEEGREPWPVVASGAPWDVTPFNLHQIEIVEFVNTFGGDIGGDGKQLTVETFQEVLDSKDSTHLASLYLTLLHVAIDNLVSRYKSLVNLWGECLDLGTYPEILMQYTKAKFHAGGVVDEETRRTVASLQTKTIGEWTCSEHCQVLAWLTNECAESKKFHDIIEQRAIEARRSKVNPGRKRVVANNPEQIVALAVTEPNMELNGELIRDEIAQDESAQIVAQEGYVKELTLRDSEAKRIEVQERMWRSRAETLGHDRNQSVYYWNLASETSCVYVHHLDNSWSKIDSETQLIEMENSLNVNGIRELELSKKLGAVRSEVVHGMLTTSAKFHLRDTLRNHEELWNINARQELHAIKYINDALVELVRDVKHVVNKAPDGTQSGWRCWTRKLSEAITKSELVNCALEMEEFIFKMSDPPRLVLQGKHAPPESIIQWTNDRLYAQRHIGVATDSHIDALPASGLRDDDESDGDILRADNDWWELIIPNDGSFSTTKRKLWKTEQERLIWKEAMTKAHSLTRVAYGIAMLKAYSRQLLLMLDKQQKEAAAEAIRLEELEDRMYASERGGYGYY